MDFQLFLKMAKKNRRPYSILSRSNGNINSNLPVDRVISWGGEISQRTVFTDNTLDNPSGGGGSEWRGDDGRKVLSGFNLKLI